MLVVWWKVILSNGTTCLRIIRRKDSRVTHTKMLVTSMKYIQASIVVNTVHSLFAFSGHVITIISTNHSTFYVVY